jgi:formate dehydrogenase maturation protein FdhE
MHALTSTQHRPHPEVAVACFERSDRQWRSRRFPSSATIEDVETSSERRDRCPSCRTIAAGPVVSSHLGGGTVAHHWKCESCELDWNTVFQPLLV